MTRDVITISRQLGSGGDEIAVRVADALGIAHVDREIITRAAAQAGVSEETIQQAETVPGLLERMAQFLARYPPDPYIEGPSPEAPPVTPGLRTEAYRHLVEDVIRRVAQSGRAVIVGHGGQVVLRDSSQALRVYVCATFETRLDRLMEEEGLDRVATEKRLRDSDHSRGDYFRTYYHANWQQPQLYDLTMNTTGLSYDTAVALIVDAAKRVD